MSTTLLVTRLTNLNVPVTTLSARGIAAADLCGEDLTHGIMQRHTSVLVGIEVVDHVQAVTPELAVEDPVSDLDAGQDAHDVERLPEGVLQLVFCKFLATLHKMFPNLGTFPHLEPLALISLPLVFPFLPFPLALLVVVIAVVSSFLPAIIVSVAITTSTSSSYEELVPTFLSSQKMADQIVFEDTLPENVRQLGDDEDERHHVRQPEVVVRHRSIFG